MIIVKKVKSRGIEYEDFDVDNLGKYSEELITVVQESITWGEVDEHLTYLVNGETIMLFSNEYWDMLTKDERADIFN